MKTSKLLTLMLFSISILSTLHSQTDISLSGNVDFVNRYVWRGIDIGSAPSSQPSIALTVNNFSFGIWGAYSLSNNAAGSDEIDLWIDYTYEFKNSMALTLLITDYTFPNSGIGFFNFNNYDNEEGPGAHTLEGGASLYLGNTFPLTLSAYHNFYNDAGSNSYFQVDYSTNVNDTELNLFCGFTPGSEDNPDYYGADEFKFINVGASVSREVKISEDFSLPIFVSYILNPNIEISYLVFGISL